MTLRIAAAVVVAAAFFAVLVYSQTRPLEPKVSGIVEADEIRLGSRVGGRVAEVLIEEGQAVKAGELLVRLEEFDLGARHAEAQSRLKAKQADWDRLKSGLRKEEVAQASARVKQLSAQLEKLVNGPLPEEIKAAEAQLELANAQHARALRSYERTTKLFKQGGGAVSAEDLDKATETLKVTAALKKARDQELALLNRGTRREMIEEARAKHEEAAQALLQAVDGYRAEDIAAAAALVEAAKAAVAIIELQQSELQIRAPVDGVIEAIELQPGDLVSASAPVLSIMDTRRMWVRAFVPERWLGRAKQNRAVKVTIDSLAAQSLSGRISFVSRQAEFTPSNAQTAEERAKQVFRVRVLLGEATVDVRPGMTADVWLPEAD